MKPGDLVTIVWDDHQRGQNTRAIILSKVDNGFDWKVWAFEERCIWHADESELELLSEA